MNKKMISFATGVMVWIAVVNFVFMGVFPLNADSPTKKKNTVVEENSFDEVTAKLEKGGNLYLYAGAERVIKTVDEFSVKLRTILGKKIVKEEEKAEILNTFDFIYNLLKKSGLMEISGVGVSSTSIGPDLNHSKIILHHYKEKGNGLIWNMTKPAPHELTFLKLLPADTVMAGYFDSGLKVLWVWLKAEAVASNLPKLKMGISVVEPMLEQQGIRLGELLDSIDGVGWALTLDSKKKISIPLGKDKPVLEIPEPALAIIFSVKDDALFNLLESKLTFAQKSPNPEVKMLQIPVPSTPFGLQPLIIQKEGFLIAASNNQIVNDIFNVKKSGKGLTASPEFRALSTGMPAEGNSFRFGSSRMFETIMELQSRLVQEETKGEDFGVMEFMKFFQKKWGMFGVLQNTDEGYIYTFNHGFNLEILVLLPVTVPLAIVAAIAIPNMLTAMQKGKQKATMMDMKKIGIAIDSYIAEHGSAPVGETLSAIADKLQPTYIEMLPLKDAWGNDFHYTHGTGEKSKDYAIGTGGKDGVFNGWEQKGTYYVSSLHDFESDIIFSNGNFTYSPMVH